MNLQFFRLIRLPNLLIILFTQYMVRFAFLYPILHSMGLKLQLDETLFFLFSIAFVLTAAGGYIINDYNDIEIDKVNRPERMIIGKGYSAPAALEMYWIFSLTGLVTGVCTSYFIGIPVLGVLFFIYMSGLWFYSTIFKFTPFLGNLVVSLFLAFVPLASGLVEVYAEKKNQFWGTSILPPSLIYHGVLLLGLFAFLANFAREIVKDAEDIEGDRKVKRYTIPIAFGVGAARVVVSVVLLVMLVLTGRVGNYALGNKDMLSVIYLFVMVALPTLIIIAGMFRAQSPKQFHRLSNGLKILMVSGISYLFVVCYNYLHTT